MDQATIDAIKEAAKSNKMPPENLSDFVLALMPIMEAMGKAAEVAEGEPDTSATDPNAPPAAPDPNMPYAAPADAAEPMDAASTTAVMSRTEKMLTTAMARITVLEAAQKAVEVDKGEQLFAQYKREGRLRLTTEAEARKDLKEHGVKVFARMYGMVSPITSATPPPAPASLPSSQEISNGQAVNGVTQPKDLIAHVVDPGAVAEWQARPENKGKSYADGLRAVSAYAHKAGRRTS